MKYNKLCVLLIILLPVGVQAQPKRKSATPVIVTVVTMQDFADEVEALGTLNARESVNLTSAVTENITKVSFVDNQRVKKGDVLVEMDSAEEVAELSEQRSIMEEAQLQVNRLTPLVKKGAASEAVLDENKRDLETAKARMNAIQSRINQRILKAPFDGVLGLRNVSVGALAQPGSVITTIDDDSLMLLDFSVPEVFLAYLKAGVMIKAKTEAYPNSVFKGEIAHIDSRIDPITRSILARAIMENDNKLLKPGLLMRVELEKNPRKALLIPEEALVANGSKNFVFVVANEDGKQIARRRRVDIGTRQFGLAEIISGLEAGETIVTHGTLRIREGSELTIKATQTANETLSELLKSNASDKGGQ